MPKKTAAKKQTKSLENEALKAELEMLKARLVVLEAKIEAQKNAPTGITYIPFFPAIYPQYPVYPTYPQYPFWQTLPIPYNFATKYAVHDMPVTYSKNEYFVSGNDVKWFHVDGGNGGNLPFNLTGCASTVNPSYTATAASTTQYQLLGDVMPQYPSTIQFFDSITQTTKITS